MKVLNRVKRAPNRYSLDGLTATYLMLSLILGGYKFFHLNAPTPTIIFFCELFYLIISVIFALFLLAKINLLLHKIHRSQFQLPSIKIQLHGFNLCAIGLWALLVIGYGTQSALSLFGSISLSVPKLLDYELFSQLLKIQFALATYLLFSMLLIFAYAFVLHRHQNINIKVIPNNFWAFENAKLRQATSLSSSAMNLPLVSHNFLLTTSFRAAPHLLVLALKLNHLKALALRQWKKESTPPSC